MDITIHSTFLPHDDRDPSLACYRDTLGFEVRYDVGYEGKRWITADPADQPAGTSIVLEPLTAGPVGYRLGGDCRFRASPFVLTRPYTPGRVDPRLQE